MNRSMRAEQPIISHARLDYIHIQVILRQHSTLAQDLRSSKLSFEIKSSLKLNASIVVHSNCQAAHQIIIECSDEYTLTPPRSHPTLSCFPVTTTYRLYRSMTDGCIWSEVRIEFSSSRTRGVQVSSGKTENCWLKPRSLRSKIPRGSSTDISCCHRIQSKRALSPDPK